ncbi:MAG: DEAD/DEAH box helicase [Halodesulfurarchaeum sp.]
MGADGTDTRNTKTESDRLIDFLPARGGNPIHVESIPETTGDYVDPASVLSTDLAEAVSESIGRLYTHQATALNRLGEGKNVCVTTSTGSGKTYVYALQIARNFLEDESSTALLVYPTKALSRDQQQELTTFFDDLGLDLSVRVYDGDTPQERRRDIRDSADAIITNFAGLNVYLAHHSRWNSFFGNLQVVCIDESHAYTGVHGMHVAWTIRRLRRVLDLYGSHPQFVLTSATIGNPRNHATRLTGTSFSVVDDDGSPRSARTIAFWNPPSNDDSPWGGTGGDTGRGTQSSPVAETGSILARLADNDAQTLAFTRSRRSAELGAKYATRKSNENAGKRGIRVAPYHAGLGKDIRRDTEYRLKTGRLDGVTSTNALELGIDIGSVDATILTGYPGTRQSFWQQVGRSGRGSGEAMSVFVAGSDAIDQYILDRPEYVLDNPMEDAVVGLGNNPVFARHVLCAAEEHPLTEADRQWFDGERLERAVTMWRDAGMLAGDLDRAVRYTGSPRPQADISIYSASTTQFTVRRRDGEIDMEPIDRQRAYRDHHEGALFLHDGAQYEVVEFEESVPNPYIVVERVPETEYTETLSEKTIRELSPEEELDLGGGYRLAWGTATVEVHYTHYRRKEIRTGRTTTSLTPTNLDPIELRTDVVWIELPPGLREEILDSVAGPGSATGTTADTMEIFGGGLHGAEHGMIKLTPLLLRLDTSDLGGLSTPAHEETGVPTIFVHDAVEGGLGFSEAIFDSIAEIVSRTKERVTNCECSGTNGCPSCIMDSQCGNRNQFLHTEATVDVLDRISEHLSAGTDLPQ